jgi:hypothetical protein
MAAASYNISTCIFTRRIRHIQTVIQVMPLTLNRWFRITKRWIESKCFAGIPTRKEEELQYNRRGLSRNWKSSCCWGGYKLKGVWPHRISSDLAHIICIERMNANKQQRDDNKKWQERWWEPKRNGRSRRKTSVSWKSEMIPQPRTSQKSRRSSLFPKSSASYFRLFSH